MRDGIRHHQSTNRTFRAAQRELETMAIRESPRSEGEYKQSTPPPNGSLLEFLRERRSPMIEPKGVSDSEAAHMEGSTFALHNSYARGSTATSSANQIAMPTNTRTASAGSSSPEATAATGAAHGVKRSRYLRETDRRSIIRRIERGEKQAALAKEFGVTRAAICHINKNRLEILMRSTRPDVHCGARHPKRGVYTATQAPSAGSTMEASRDSPMVYEVRSQALSMLMTSLRSRDTDSRNYRTLADRAFRLLIEEAIASVPTRSVDVTTSTGFVCQGIVANQPTCAMFMSECGYPLLEAFRVIQPDSPTGFMTLQHDDASDSGMDGSAVPLVRLRKMSAPPKLSNHNVFLLDATCATSNEAVVAIQSLIDFGAHENAIYFVALVFSATAVAEICEQFPTLHIVTGAIDPDTLEGDMICPGIGRFQERYFNTTTIRQTHLGANVFL